jgi:hypothetical protein
VTPTTQPAESQPVGTEPSNQPQEDQNSVIWIVIAAVVVVAGVVTAIVLIRKRKQ